MTNHHDRSPRLGYSLIELLIAIALGSLIIVVATAGFSVAARTVTASNAIARENSLVRAAVLQACDEVDFWTMVDDPTDTHAQTLRGAIAGGGGMPFTALSASGFGSTPIAPPFVRTEPERVATWEGGPMGWAAADPRSWCRASLVETLHTDMRFGDYSILACDSTLGSSGMFDPGRCRSWYDNQVECLFNSLGFYGTLEYLPSNAFLMYHGAPPLTANPSGVSAGNVPNALLDGWTWFGIKFQEFSVGRFRTTDAMVISLPNPASSLLPSYTGTQDPFRTSWRVGYGGAGGYLGGNENSLKESDNFHKANAFMQELMPSRPGTWSDVTYKVERFIRQGRAVAICVIEITNPLTGEKTTVPFSTRGTSLRGARLQRAPASGWSTYDNHDPVHPTIGSSLDCSADTSY